MDADRGGSTEALPGAKDGRNRKSKEPMTEEERAAREARRAAKRREKGGEEPGPSASSSADDLSRNKRVVASASAPSFTSSSQALVPGTSSADAGDDYSNSKIAQRRAARQTSSMTADQLSSLSVDTSAVVVLSSGGPDSSVPTTLHTGHRRLATDMPRTLAAFKSVIFDFDGAFEGVEMQEGNTPTPGATLPRKSNIAPKPVLTRTLSRRKNGESGDEQEVEVKTGTIGWTTSLFYVFLLLLLLVASLGYTLLDIFISYGFSRSVSNGDAIFSTTIGLISSSFDFLWKFMVCIYVFPLAVKRSDGSYNLRKILSIAALGSLYHMACLALVRGPTAAAGGIIYADINALRASSVISLLLQYALDFIALPFFFRREHNRLAPEEYQLKAKKRGGLLALVYTWMSAWVIALFCEFYVGLDYSAAGLAMDLILWLPLILVFIYLVRDTPPISVASANYLVVYLWVMYLLPFFTGSVLNLYRELSASFVQFIITVLYIVIVQIIFSFAVGVSKNMTRARTHVAFLFLLQFYDNFFGALFFINEPFGSNYLPWLILAVQSLWIIIRNSGLSKDFTVFLIFKYEPVLKQFSLFRFISNTTFEAGSARLNNQIKLASQYTICDCISLISIPVQYYAYTSTLPPALLPSYAADYGMTMQQHNDGELAIRFAIIAAFRITAHVIAYLLMWLKVRRYNSECVLYAREPLHIGWTLFNHLKSNWIYLIIMCIEVMRLSYFMLSALLLTENVAINADMRGRFWFVVNFLHLGYR